MTNPTANLLDGSIDEEVLEECPPAADGIFRCLAMLADEAARLDMTQTLDAVRIAMAACALEASALDAMEAADNAARIASLGHPTGTRLH